MDTLDQALDLLHTALTAHGRTGYAFNLLDRIGTIGDGVDDIHLGYIHTDTQVPVQVLFQNRR
jgi:hypothetical protein